MLHQQHSIDYAVLRRCARSDAIAIPRRKSIDKIDCSQAWSSESFYYFIQNRYVLEKATYDSSAVSCPIDKYLVRSDG